MKKPTEPKKEDCCNSGCTPCIFDVYEKQLQLYESYLKYGEKPAVIKKENAISQLAYTLFHVIKTVDICREHKLLLFKHSNSLSDKEVLWNPGEHFLFKYESIEQSCTRAYTPLKMELLFKEDYDFAIIVKQYDNGLVSNHLFHLKSGENTLWRGPYGNYHIESKLTRLIMIAQGTGIAPFYTIIKTILEDDENMTSIMLFYCCKDIETVLLRNEFYSLKSYWNFNYSLHLSDSSDRTLHKYQEPIFERLNGDVILNLAPFSDKDQILLCGSEEFMKCYKKGLVQEKVNIFTF